MRVTFSLKLTLLAYCSPLAPLFARISACSFPDIPQWAGIHCRTALLVAATCCRALVRFGSLWFWYACRMERVSGIQLVYIHDLKPALWRQPVWGLLFLHGNWSRAFLRPCLLRLSVLLGSVPAPPLVTAFIADPSVNTWTLASCGYLSAVIARARDCFTVSSCVFPSEREGTVVWTLMSVMSVTQGSDMSGGKKGSVLWDSLSWNWRLSFLLSWTKLLLFSWFLVRPPSLVFMGWLHTS